MLVSCERSLSKNKEGNGKVIVLYRHFSQCFQNVLVSCERSLSKNKEGNGKVVIVLT